MTIDINSKNYNILEENCGDPLKNSIRPKQRVGTRMVYLEEEKQIIVFGGLDN